MSGDIGRHIHDDVIAPLLGAAMHFLMGRNRLGIKDLKKANVALVTLTVAAESAAGPIKLPPIKRGKR